MHMVSKRDFNSAELETMRISRRSTMAMTDLPLDQRSKTTSHPKRARELIAIYQTMCHS